MIHDYARGWVVRCPACEGRGHLIIRGGAHVRCRECSGEGRRLAPPQWRDPWEEAATAPGVNGAHAITWSAGHANHHDVV
jgi:hypothetical protein